MSFTLTRQTDYALQLLRALRALAPRHTLSLATFAAQNRVSFLFLQRIATKLRQAGLVRSVAGRSGGYRLARPSKQITIRQVATAMEGDLSVVPCVAAGHVCPRRSTCHRQCNFRRINQAMLQYLKTITVSDL